MGLPNAAALPDIAQKQGFFALLASHPTGFWFIFWGEFAERCSYYGMRAILATYMVERLGLSQSNASFNMSLFIAGCYLLPLAGAAVADNYLGKYRTIIFFSLPYILGHLILGIEETWAVVLALSLLAMGAGVIKPNISTLMGMTYDQFKPGQEQLRSSAFSLFYMAINIGAFLSQLAIPWIRTTSGSYFLAFLFPAGLMVLAFTVFALGKPFYATEKIQRVHRTPEERALQWRIVGQVAGLFLLVMFFWAVFDQSASTWIFFARSHMDLNVFGVRIDPEQVQAVNPLLIVLFLPFITALWVGLDNAGIKVRATDKMMLGFGLTALCMGVMAWAGWMAGPGVTHEIVREGKQVIEVVVAPENKVTVWWQMFAYLIITIAEILISVTGLELAFVAAPKTMKSFVTSLWLLTVFLANLLINAPVTQLYEKMTPAAYFGMLTVAMLVVTLVFAVVAKRFNRLAEEAARVENDLKYAIQPANGALESPAETHIRAEERGIKKFDS